MTYQSMTFPFNCSQSLNPNPSIVFLDMKDEKSQRKTHNFPAHSTSHKLWSSMKSGDLREFF